MDSQEPDLQLDGFSLFVFGRQFETANDYWDGNWLSVLARAEAELATVEARGAFVHLSEIARFAKELNVLIEKLDGSASLRCMEPNLAIELRAARLGHVDMTLHITPDHRTQWHKFQFEIDQTFLVPVSRACKKLLTSYPIRGTPDKIPADLLNN